MFKSQYYDIKDFIDKKYYIIIDSRRSGKQYARKMERQKVLSKKIESLKNEIQKYRSVYKIPLTKEDIHNLLYVYETIMRGDSLG